MLVAALLLVLNTASPAAVTSTEAEAAVVAQRLTARALDTLEGIVGPGRVKLQVEVQGEHSEIQTQSEFVTPIEKPAPPSVPAQKSLRLVDLPGYVKDRMEDVSKPKNDKKSSEDDKSNNGSFYQKDNEHSVRDTGFVIKSIQAVVVLDSTLDDNSVREVTQLLPQLLRLDTQRGDVLSILRAPMKAPWKLALATPEHWRQAVYILSAALVLIIIVLIISSAMVRAGRALGHELATGRVGASNTNAEELPLESLRSLPELTPGAPPGLLDANVENVQDGLDVPLLGRRFDFLNGREPAVVASVLAQEKPEDLSMLFGHLSESMPDLASKLFSSLPQSVQAELSQALLKLSVSDPEKLSLIEERVRKGVENGVMGPQSLGRILSRVSNDTRSELMGRLAAKDVHAAQEVEKHLFTFNDLESLPQAQIRRLLVAIPYDVWGLALRGSSTTLIEIILADLPEGPREMVRSAVANPQPRDKVVEAQSKILDILNQLIAKGDISLERATKDGGLV